MRCNVGGVDRTLRLIAGAALLLIGLFAPLATGWQIIVFILAAIALVTGAVQYCPLNALIGLNTCRSDGGAGRAK